MAIFISNFINRTLKGCAPSSTLQVILITCHRIKLKQFVLKEKEDPATGTHRFN